MSQRPGWDSLFMSMAMLFSMRSPDTSTRVGCVIADRDNTVMSLGYNGWPRGVQSFEPGDARFQRPEKYMWMEHAERNAIYNACRNGTPLNHCTLYATLFPCADCARGIIQVGIERVVYHGPSTQIMRQMNQQWDAFYGASMRMFNEAGIEVVEWFGDIVIPEGQCQGQSMHFC
jgi:dCMP deaminase